MKRVAIVTPGILPVPNVSGGAVEGLITKIIEENEKNDSFAADVFTVSDERIDSGNYKNTRIIQINRTYCISFLDRAIDKIIRTFKLKRSFRLFDRRLVHYLKDVNSELENNFGKGYDVILVENMTSLYRIVRKAFPDIRILFHIHNNIDIYRDEKTFKKMTVDNTCVITVSSFLTDAIRKIRGCGQLECKTLLNSVNRSLFKCIPSAEKHWLREKSSIAGEGENNRFVFLFSGRIIPEKGVIELLNSFERLCAFVHENNTKKIPILYMAGCSRFGTSKMTAYEKTVYKKADNMKNVQMLGFIPSEKMSEIYCAADVAVVPTLIEESFGMVAAEALSVGVPLIVSRSGGLTEIVDEKCAIIINRNEHFEESLFGAMRHMLELPEYEYAEMKLAAEKRFSIVPELDDRNYFDRFVRCLD